eukprot:jgi/Mesvir1/5145/Mv15288-RA.1
MWPLLFVWILVSLALFYTLQSGDPEPSDIALLDRDAPPSPSPVDSSRPVTDASSVSFRGLASGARKGLVSTQTAVLDSFNPLSFAGSALNGFGLLSNPLGNAVSRAGSKTTSFLVRHTPVAALLEPGKSLGCRAKRLLTYNFAKC